MDYVFDGIDSDWEIEPVRKRRVIKEADYGTFVLFANSHYI
jgi:hypothetical protein